jgi:pyoverdine/dityrosine biosynthesis protein Dit1
MGYRYTLVNPDLHVFSDSIYVALNQIYVVFNKNKNVLKAIKKMHDDLGNQQKFSDNLITLIKEIAKSLKVSTAEFNDRFFEIPFYPSFKKNKDLL